LIQNGVKPTRDVDKELPTLSIQQILEDVKEGGKDRDVGQCDGFTNEVCVDQEMIVEVVQ